MLKVSSVKTARWWWLLLASFAIGLLALAPAALVERATNDASTAAAVQARFVAESGTIWTGRGRIIVSSAASPVVIPFGWRFDPLSLFALRLGVFVDSGSPSLTGVAHLGIGFRDVELREATIDADARLLSTAHNAAALFAPTGRIRIVQAGDERFLVRPASSSTEAWRVDGPLSLNANQFAMGGAINVPTGDHEFKLRGEGSVINVTVLRSTGPLKLEGAGTLALAAPRRFTFSGFATAAGDAPPALKQLGPVMADGRQRIELNTAW